MNKFEASPIVQFTEVLHQNTGRGGTRISPVCSPGVLPDPGVHTAMYTGGRWEGHTVLYIPQLKNEFHLTKIAY